MTSRESALYTGFFSATTRMAVSRMTPAKYPKKSCPTIRPFIPVDRRDQRRLTETRSRQLRLLRHVLEGNVKKGHIRMLQLQTLFPEGKGAVADGKQLFFVQIELPLIVHCPFKLLRHAQGIDRTGLHAHPAE